MELGKSVEGLIFSPSSIIYHATERSVRNLVKISINNLILKSVWAPVYYSIESSINNKFLDLHKNENKG